MTKKTKGSEQLEALVRPKRAFTLTEIAKRLGVSRQTVDTWCSGASRPKLSHVLKMEELLGISHRDWGPLMPPELPNQKTEEPTEKQVYFAQRGDTGPIKIGFSKNPKLRIAEIQVASAEPIRIIFTMSGTKDLEKQIHGLFHHLRLKGEWFRADVELLSWIEQQRSFFEKKT